MPVDLVVPVALLVLLVHLVLPLLVQLVLPALLQLLELLVPVVLLYD